MKFARKNQSDATPASNTGTSAPSGADVPTASDGLVAPPSTPQTPAAPTPASASHRSDSRPAPAEAADEVVASRPEPSTSDPVADPPAPTPAGLTGKGRVRRTRVSALWIGVVVAAILAIFLLIFIAQNSDDVTITFLGWDGQVPLAVAMLLTAVVAVLVVAVPGSLRIGQLRRALRKNAHS